MDHVNIISIIIMPNSIFQCCIFIFSENLFVHQNTLIEIGIHNMPFYNIPQKLVMNDYQNFMHQYKMFENMIYIFLIRLTNWSLFMLKHILQLNAIITSIGEQMIAITINSYRRSFFNLANFHKKVLKSFIFFRQRSKKIFA